MITNLIDWIKGLDSKVVTSWISFFTFFLGVTVAQRNFNKGQKPYFSVELEKESNNYSFYLKNVGKTPAYQMRCNWKEKPTSITFGKRLLQIGTPFTKDNMQGFYLGPSSKKHLITVEASNVEEAYRKAFDQKELEIRYFSSPRLHFFKNFLLKNRFCALAQSKTKIDPKGNLTEISFFDFIRQRAKFKKSAINFLSKILLLEENRPELYSDTTMLCIIFKIDDHRTKVRFLAYSDKARNNIAVHDSVFDKTVIQTEYLIRKVFNTKELKEYENKNAAKTFTITKDNFRYSIFRRAMNKKVEDLTLSTKFLNETIKHFTLRKLAVNGAAGFADNSPMVLQLNKDYLLLIQSGDLGFFSLPLTISNKALKQALLENKQITHWKKNKWRIDCPDELPWE